MPSSAGRVIESALEITSANGCSRPSTRPARLNPSSCLESWATCSEHGVPCGAVNDVLGVLDDPQVAARDALVSYAHPRLGEVRQFASPLRMGTSYTPAPARGEGTEPLLRELCGYDDARLRSAREEGAFG